MEYLITPHETFVLPTFPASDNSPAKVAQLLKRHWKKYLFDGISWFTGVYSKWIDYPKAERFFANPNNLVTLVVFSRMVTQTH